MILRNRSDGSESMFSIHFWTRGNPSKFSAPTAPEHKETPKSHYKRSTSPDVRIPKSEGFPLTPPLLQRGIETTGNNVKKGKTREFAWISKRGGFPPFSIGLKKCMYAFWGPLVGAPFGAPLRSPVPFRVPLWAAPFAPTPSLFIPWV